MTAVVVTVVSAVASGWLTETVDKVTNPPERAALGVHMTWPVASGCDTSAVAMPAGGRALGGLAFSFEEDPRITAAKAGAASWENGTLALTLTNETADPIHIDAIQPRVLRTDPNARFSWVLRKVKGCGGGGGPVRYLKFDLDRDRLVISDGERDVPYGSPDGPAVTDLTVTRDKPAHVNLAVRSCKAYYEWVIDVTYTLGNRRLSQRIDNLRSAGGIAGVPVYDMVSGPTGAREAVSTGKATSAVCESKG